MGDPPEVKGVVPKEIFQVVKSEDIWETDLEAEPKYVPWMFISNIIRRVFARMIGQGPYGPVAVKCTADGSLAVVQRGGAFDDYEKIEHDFAETEAARTTDATTAFHCKDASENFVTDGILAGALLKNVTDTTYALVTVVADGDLTLDKDIIESGETYIIIPYHEFTFSQQVTRIDVFTYDGKVDYELSRDAVKAYGDKIELFEDSFYSLDFFTLRVRATPVSFVAATPTRSKVMGWFREGG